MLPSHDLPPPPLDKSHSDHGLDIQPDVIDVTGCEEPIVIRTPSHSLPAVAFPSLQADDVHQKQALTAAVTAHGGFTPASKSGSGTLQHDQPVLGDGGGLDGSGGFLDVDDDVAIHIDRDPNHWHDMVRIKFDDIFGEPEPEVFSKDNVWTTANKVYTFSKIWCYRIVSLVLAVPLAALWGVSFACLVFCRIWCCVPCFRACDIQLHCCRRFNETFIRTCIAPIFEAAGRMCYHVRIRVLKSTDDNP